MFLGGIKTFSVQVIKLDCYPAQLVHCQYISYYYYASSHEREFCCAKYQHGLTCGRDTCWNTFSPWPWGVGRASSLTNTINESAGSTTV